MEAAQALLWQGSCSTAAGEQKQSCDSFARARPDSCILVLSILNSFVEIAPQSGQLRPFYSLPNSCREAGAARGPKGAEGGVVLLRRSTSNAASGSGGQAGDLSTQGWVLVRGFNLSYHNEDTILVTIDPYSGSLNPIP